MAYDDGRNKAMRKIIFAVALLAFVLGQLLIAADEPVTIVRVRPSKILYLVDEKANADILLKNNTEAEINGTLLVREEWDLTEGRDVWSGPVTLPAGKENTVTIQWDLGEEQFGRALRAAFVIEGKPVASSAEYFQVAREDNWWRMNMLNYGGSEAHGEKARTDPFSTYSNFDNHFAYAESDFSHLAPKGDVWYSGQVGYHIEKKKLIESIRERQSIGVRAGAYTNGSTGGVAGYELARQHPEWFMRNKKGAFLTAYGTPVSPIDVSRTTKDRMKTWYALAVDFGNPDVVRYGAEEIVRAIEMFKWDTVFFDGVYSVMAIAGMPYLSPSSTSFDRFSSDSRSYSVPTKIERPIAAALSLTTSSMEVVIPSLARSFPTTLVPPDTLRIIGLVLPGSTDERNTPLVMKKASA